MYYIIITKIYVWLRPYKHFDEHEKTFYAKEYKIEVTSPYILQISHSLTVSFFYNLKWSKEKIISIVDTLSP